MSPDLPLVLYARGLGKSFGRKVAVDAVDLRVARGEIVGFLGPNGAGKTTVLSMVSGLIRPDCGSIELFGVPEGPSRPALRSRLGFLQEKPCIYPELSARAYLRLFASLYRVPNARSRVDALIERLDLGHAAERPLKTYSRGMQQRTCLARVMLHDPELLVLDEPTLGLDPAGVSEMRDVLLELNRTGVALLFSSHQLADMERISDRVVLMHEGRVIADGATETVTRRFNGVAEARVELDVVTPAVLAALRALPIVASAERHDDRHVTIRLTGGEGDETARRVALSSAVAKAGGIVLFVSLRRGTLEEAFLAMTQASRRDDQTAPERKRVAIG